MACDVEEQYKGITGLPTGNTKEGRSKAGHVLKGFSFIEQLTGPAAKRAPLSNTEHFL